jgi:CheY-like chemotaxis protein
VKPDVLLVDDDPDLRVTICLVLEEEGYAVEAVANGQEALDRLSGGLRPGMILLDLMMPEMDGWEFLRARRRTPALAEIPVTIYSALDAVAPTDAEALAQPWLRKPSDIESLLGAVRRCCDTARSDEAAAGDARVALT